ncbi:MULTISPECIES: phosphoribosyltransferase [Gordonia]|jgi:predicted phosphoribosyltransferase|uniref:phosphoribosyltransferase n=1 Tax=Gordonia TaxID=2053 RepID=UPI0012BB2FC3|nr:MULTISPECIES: phosphoribosyltransferase family protein [Gordonia]MDH3008239.1 phosphoribosyltransferase family protein [Gordonia alkanivorans]MDH3017181.1 phosphoribosyltransferase family protein [Gordonia alkanivorans]MDH3042426.1 phosphoribosyltransferase family protein [Gordonia alkanivorans]MDH3046445.1 phosphoribosyltransferase family protein [Gordonia alkanivorans]MDH3059999.1 phosphoribosyltransferase family protein [Gordonia alkanivorans]
MSGRVFPDRIAAGRALGARVAEGLRSREDTHGARPVVIGLARGGVPVAREVADATGGDLDALVVRKIGAPGHEEFAMGALTAGHLVVNDDIPRRLGVSRAEFDAVADRERRILHNREELYRGGRPPVEVEDRVVVLVDDGLATGSTMAVAIDAMDAAGAARLIVAVPTAPSDSVGRLIDRGVDDVVVLTTPEPFEAVGLSYDDFSQVDDEEVIECLERDHRP